MFADGDEAYFRYWVHDTWANRFKRMDRLVPIGMKRVALRRYIQEPRKDARILALCRDWVKNAPSSVTHFVRFRGVAIYGSSIYLLRGASGPHTSPGVLGLGEDLATEGRRLFGANPQVGAKCTCREGIQSVDFEKFTNSVSIALPRRRSGVVATRLKSRRGYSKHGQLYWGVLATISTLFLQIG